MTNLNVQHSVSVHAETAHGRWPSLKTVAVDVNHVTYVSSSTCIKYKGV